MVIFSRILLSMSKGLNVVAGAALIFMMFLTVADVLGRAFGHPILGSYEIVGLSLAIVIGFGLPQVSIDRAHIFIEVLLGRFGPKGVKLMSTFTRLLSLGLFILIGYNLITVGAEFRSSGEVSSTLKIPFYPLPYAEGICCLILCLVFIREIIKIWRDHHE